MDRYFIVAILIVSTMLCQNGIAKEQDYSQLIQTTNITNQRINDLKSDFNGLRSEFNGLRSEFKEEIGQLKTDVSQLKVDVGQLKTDVGNIKNEINSNRDSINSIFYLLITGFITMITGTVILYLQNKKDRTEAIETKTTEKTPIKTVSVEKQNNPHALKNPQQNFDESFFIDIIDRYMKKNFQGMPQGQFA